MNGDIFELTGHEHKELASYLKACILSEDVQKMLVRYPSELIVSVINCKDVDVRKFFAPPMVKYNIVASRILANISEEKFIELVECLKQPWKITEKYKEISTFIQKKNVKRRIEQELNIKEINYQERANLFFEDEFKKSLSLSYPIYSSELVVMIENISQIDSKNFHDFATKWGGEEIIYATMVVMLTNIFAFHNAVFYAGSKYIQENTLEIGEEYFKNLEGSYEKALDAAISVTRVMTYLYMLDENIPRYGLKYVSGKIHNRFDSSAKSKNAKKGYEKSDKNIFKEETVYPQWKIWQEEEPKLYKNQTHFINSMVDMFKKLNPDVSLTDKTVWNWIKEFKTK